MSSDGSPCELLSQILWHNGFAYAIRHLPQAEDALLLVHSYCPIRTPDKRKAPTELRMATETS